MKHPALCISTGLQVVVLFVGLLAGCRSAADTQTSTRSHTTTADTASVHIRATDYAAALRLTVAAADSARLTLTADSVRRPDGTVIYRPRLDRRDYRPTASTRETATRAHIADTRAKSGHHDERDSTASHQRHTEHRALHPPDWLALVLALVLAIAGAVLIYRDRNK